MNSTRSIDRRWQAPPLTTLGVAVAIGLAVAVGVVLLAVDQPWLGVGLSPEVSGSGVVVRSAEGPGKAIAAGTVLRAVSGEGDWLELESFDLIAEPDGAMGGYENYRRFLERQERLSKIQASRVVVFADIDGNRLAVHPVLEGRPLSSLPAEFWVQVCVGFVAWLVSAGVFAFRPREISARYLLLSGGATLMFAPLAAVYSTRELALPGAVFQWLNDLNFLGGSLFAASFVGMLLHYPRRIAPVWVGIAVVGIFVGWFVLQQAGVFESMTFARRFLVLIGVGSTFGLAGVHWWQTRKDPIGRAALQWFLLSWMAGTMLFALFILLPQMFGVDTSPLQGYAFLLFLLVYGGLAFGITRYRLFELGEWWRRIAVWTIAVLLLVVLDLFFVMQLHLSAEVSLSLALLICGLGWLPLRAWVWLRFVEGRKFRSEDLFGQVMDTALAATGGAQQEKWERLLQEVFDPLQVLPAEEAVEEVGVAREGLVLELPGVGRVSSLRLEFAGGGRRLFTQRDAILAAELATMLGYAIESRRAYEKGVEEERGRIARDLHDNIGARLLAALHHREAEEKDGKIRETLVDLREIINDVSRAGISFEETLADLRLETAERLAAAGISLEWAVPEEEPPVLAPKAIHALRSIVREAVSNVIRHSGARNVRLSFGFEGGMFSLEMEDDGAGFEPDEDGSGRGLANMRERLTELRGKLRFIRSEAGVRLVAGIPHEPGTLV